METTWLNKSLETLEKHKWSRPENDSDLLTRCHALRKLPLAKFKIEDLRLMISQGIGLRYLIPFAIEKLKENILAQGDSHQGDLLQATRKVSSSFWAQYPQHRIELNALITQQLELLSSHGVDAFLV
ncbi:contact-dependent growth inhibition system immunity protein [Sabulibacter ruber]|uniref:contact-dependent growth inhibition system immunity protein n=1 Tax=Sabulibacter ruber TaxID=2811901 RepID=UPI001A97791D|nr:contact-dependent growth inhibition system immunity protein [Sabulibacter ruber]